jgi:UDP-N-acetylmuramate--alanine ligase
VNDFTGISNVYFIGAGGIGMSALARYFHAMGKIVAGYDRSPTALTKQMINEGIYIHYDDSARSIPEPFLNRKKTLVVFTPAIPRDNEILGYFRDNRYTLLKRAEILGLIAEDKLTIAIAGTHGKTTVTTMIAWIMSHTRESCSAFLGGISKNFNNNLYLQPSSNRVIAEADEYDRSFLHLHPFGAVITSMDADHLDIYGDIKELYRSFNLFAAQINPSGFLVIKKGLPMEGGARLDCRIYSYSVKEKADYFAANITLKDDRYTFDVNTPDGVIHSLSPGHPGMVNVENAVAAVAVCHLMGCDGPVIRQALASFSGNQRRFDVILKTGRIIFIDDYAHHPSEIEATILSARELYPGKRITGVFQPHLYSRTRDLALEFASSLSLLDELILLDIYPAREKPIPGITADSIFRHVTLKKKMMVSGSSWLEMLKEKKPEVLITMGAGDIDQIVEPIKQILSR